jgi:diacylglycerol kinase family enzyme
VASAFARRGVAARCETVPGGELRAAAERALDEARRGEAEIVAVGGGDGSVRAVAGVLAETTTPLGILPLGTLNHFAKDLGIPLDLDAAVGAICNGAAHAVDVAEVNGEVFINNSSVGIYPYMVLDRDRRRNRHGWAKWVAMIAAALRSLRQFPMRRLSICLAERTQPIRTPCLFVGNNAYELSLASLGRRGRLDRGELWLCVAKAQSPPALLWLALRSALGRIDGERDLQIARASAAEIHSRASRLHVALDGEVSELRPPLRYRTRPRALRVIAPAQRAG